MGRARRVHRPEPGGRDAGDGRGDQGITLIGSQPIVEYFDETVDRMPMIHGNAALRAEIRRMTDGSTSSSIAKRSSR